jgi:hypothetical protein
MKPKDKIKYLRDKNENKNKNDNKKEIEKKIEDIYFEKLKKKANNNIDIKIKYIFININGKISNTQVSIPVIKYII